MIVPMLMARWLEWRLLLFTEMGDTEGGTDRWA